MSEVVEELRLPAATRMALPDGTPVWWIQAGDRVVMEISITGAVADTAVIGDWAADLAALPVSGLIDAACGHSRCWIDLDLPVDAVSITLARLEKALRERPTPRPGIDTRSGWGVRGGEPAWPAGRTIVIAAPQDPRVWLPALALTLDGYGSGAAVSVPLPEGVRRDTGTGIGLAFPDSAVGDWYAAVLLGRTTARLPDQLRERRGTLYDTERDGPWWVLDTPDDTATLSLVEANLAAPPRAEEWARAATWLRTDTLRLLDAPADLVWLATTDALAGRVPLSRAAELLRLSEPPASPPPVAILIGGSR